MGGHGELRIGLTYPQQYRAVSAFSPSVATTQVPWGAKAPSRYRGPDRQAWREHDAVALNEDDARHPALIVDQGEADSFLTEQLYPELLASACQAAGIHLPLHLRPGYDQSYYFVSAFMKDHLAWHKQRLG